VSDEVDAEADAPIPRRGRLKKRRCCGCCLGQLLFAFLLMLLYLAGAEEPVTFAEAPGLVVTPMQPLVPGPGLPADLPLQASNNNCDAAHFSGRFYLAFRTGPHHFASPETELLILSSEDRETWTHEHTVHVGADLREPRFLVYKGRLFFYYFEAGTNPVAFEPRRIQAIERRADGTWSEPTPVYEPGFVVWRAKAHGGVAYMSVYKGDLYKTRGRGAEVRLLRSLDGLSWAPISEAPQITDDAASECAFAFTPDGGLVAVVRVEVAGSIVATAEPGDLANWTLVRSPHKYDSPLMLRRGDDYYLIARRNVAGRFLRYPEWLPGDLRKGLSLARYSLTRKRTCVYRVNVEEGRLEPLLDLPSSGDTAFPAVAPMEDGRWWLVNYSSPLDGPDLPWLAGQLRDTRLYAAELTLPAGR
jgi:hypothetical protein